MYNVSDEYKQTVAQLDREFSVRVQIYLRDKTILTLGEDDILPKDMENISSDRYIKGDLKIESQMMSGGASSNMIDIGAVPSKKLDMTVYSPTTDLHVFSGAYLWIYVSLLLPSGAWEPVPMGKFYINGASISREGNWVSFTAYDGMLKLQYELTTAMRAELKGKTALEAAQILCGNQLPFVLPKNPEGEAITLPNSDLELDFDSEQIETARDGIMWIAQLMGCFARVNRLGQLEFVQIKSWWKMYTETTGTILAVRNIQGDQRFKTKFADDRIHIVGVSMRGADNKLVTQRYGYSHENEEDPTSDVTVEMATNPLIISSDKPLSEILGNILAELSTAYFYSFSTEMANDPALDAGDTIRLKGGVINGTNHNNDLIGFITHNVWRYRGHQEITNASSVPIVFDGGDSESGTPARSRARSASAARSDDDLNFLPPKPQSEKALQGRDSATKLVGNFGKQYVFKWTNPYYLEAFDGDGKEMFKLSVLPFSVEKGNSHITLGSDYIEIKNAETRGREFSFYIHENGQTRITDSSGNDVFSIIPAGGLMEYKVGSQSFQVWLNTGEIKMNGKTVWAPWMA